MALSKRNDPQRRLRSFLRHTLLMVPPFAVAGTTVGLWSWLRAQGIHLPIDDEVSLTTSIMWMGSMFAILAALVVAAIFDKYQKVSGSVLRRDRHEFLQYRDERIPIVLHQLLGSISVLLLAMVMLLEYKSYWSGFAATFTSSFGLTIYWVVGTELQNPAKSAWFAERIPKEWLEADIDEEFKLELAASHQTADK